MPNRGITIADFVQQVLFKVYGVRLDTEQGAEGGFHSKSDKFKEIVMQANMQLKELQRAQDWNWLRDRWEIAMIRGGDHEFRIPEEAYKVCCGYGDAVRLHTRHHVMQIPFTSPRQGNRFQRQMYSAANGEYNTFNMEQQAFIVGDTLAFKRPFTRWESGKLETDVILRLEPLHICTDECEDNCPLSYEQKVLTEMPDVDWVIASTAAKRAEIDPSAADRVQSLTDEAKQILSSYREDDSAHNVPDYWDTVPLGYVEVL